VGNIVNLTDRRAARSRALQLDLLANDGPDRIVAEIARAEGRDPSPATAATDEPLLPHLVMPAHHDIRPKDVMLRRLHGSLAAAAERGPADFAELLLGPGVGARTVRALAQVAEVIHGAPHRFADPARFAMAHGGKDGHPFPVPLKVYDETIRVLRYAVAKARLGNNEEIAAMKRLDDQARLLERTAAGPTLPEFIAEERRLAPVHGGRTVMDDAAERHRGRRTAG
jgi:hypothetical protein